MMFPLGEQLEEEQEVLAIGFGPKPCCHNAATAPIGRPRGGLGVCGVCVWGGGSGGEWEARMS